MRVAHEVWRPEGRKTCLPRKRHGFPSRRIMKSESLTEFLVRLFVILFTF